jgi:6-phosphogluconolactonase (cycloisomerase 2 family)
MQRLTIRPFECAILSLVFIWLGCGGNSTVGHSPIQPAAHDLIYTANAAGSPATVSAFSQDRISGALTAVAGSPFTTGSGSLALATDGAYKFLFVANMFSGDISAFTVNTTSGVLTPVAGSPFAAEFGIDSIAVDRSGSNLYAVSLHSSNVYAYSIGSTGTLSPLSGFPVTVGPSAIASNAVVLDVSGAFLYIVTVDSMSAAAVYGFSRDLASGALSPLAGFPVPVDGRSNTAVFEPGNKFLLVTGTGVFGTVGGVSVFSLNNSTGALTPVAAALQVGTDPSGVVTDKTGHFVYIPNTGDATISELTLDASGGLASIGSPVPSGGNGSINGPMGVATDVAGHFVYVCNASNDISVFSINASDGALTPVAGSPFSTGNGPHAILFMQGKS